MDDHVELAAEQERSRRNQGYPSTTEPAPEDSTLYQLVSEFDQMAERFFRPAPLKFDDSQLTELSLSMREWHKFPHDLAARTESHGNLAETLVKMQTNLENQIHNVQTLRAIEGSVHQLSQEDPHKFEAFR